MKVKNMTSVRTGRSVLNQFIIDDVPNNMNLSLYRATCKLTLYNANGTIFQSYNSIICWKHGKIVILDKTYWNYSTTTSKYRNQFLGETTKETQAKIDSGEYILTDLN